MTRTPAAATPASAPAGAPAENAAPERLRDATRTRTEILDIATTEFAAHGYHGARVDTIAALTRTTKRMIYYHFGSKKQLYIAVLERAYVRIRSAERDVNIDNLDPITALRRIAEVTFDHHQAHPDFIRLVSIENIHNAEHVKELATLVDLAGPVTSLLDTILENGRATGLFHHHTDATDVHMMISAFCFFRVANRHTFGAIFGRDLLDPHQHDHYRTMCGDMIVRYLAADPAQPPSGASPGASSGAGSGVGSAAGSAGRSADVVRGTGR